MTTVSLIKKMEKKGFVMVPRDEYEDLLIYKRLGKPIKEFTPSKSELAALRRARKEFKEGKTISLHELKQKLGFKN